MSLLAPLFLLGLLGLAIPWILHRLQQRDAPATEFPSKRFLKTTSSNTARRKRLRFRWLLSLRWLLLALLCFLFAEPLLNKARQGAGEARLMHLLVLDNSFSMRHGERWQRAIEQLEEVVAGLSSDDAVALMLADTNMQLVRDEQVDSESGTDTTSNQGDAREVLRQLQILRQDGPGSRRLQFEKMMDAVDRFAQDSELPVQAHVVTDAQQNAIRTGFNTLYRERLQGLEVFGVTTEQDSNVSVHASADWIDATSVAVDTRLLWSMSGTAGTQNSESSGNSIVTVEVSSSDQVLAETEIELQPGVAAGVRLDAIDVATQLRQLAGSGADSATLMPLEVTIRGELLDADGLADDNRSVLGLPRHAPQQIRILATEPLQQENARVYLSTAFRQMQNVEVEEISANSRTLPPDTDLLVVLQSARDNRLPQVAASFMSRGGAVLQVLGGPEIQQDLASRRNTSAQLQIDADPMTRIDTAHPLALSARDWSEAVLYREIWDERNLQELRESITRSGGSGGSTDNSEAIGSAGSRISPSDVADTLRPLAGILVSSNRGTPVLLEPLTQQEADVRPRWLVLAVPLDGSSSSLPISPVFVSFLNKLRGYLLQSSRYPRQLFSGETMNFASNAQLLSPDGDAVFELAAGSGTRSYTLDDTGAYVVLDQSGQHVVQVNIDPAESDMSTISADGLALWQQQYEDEAEDAGTGSGDGANNATDTANNTAVETADKSGTPLWYWLLPALLIAGLLELFLGNWHLGRFRRALSG